MPDSVFSVSRWPIEFALDMIQSASRLDIFACLRAAGTLPLRDEGRILRISPPGVLA